MKGNEIISYMNVRVTQKLQLINKIKLSPFNSNRIDSKKGFIFTPRIENNKGTEANRKIVPNFLIENSVNEGSKKQISISPHLKQCNYSNFENHFNFSKNNNGKNEFDSILINMRQMTKRKNHIAKKRHSNQTEMQTDINLIKKIKISEEESRLKTERAARTERPVQLDINLASERANKKAKIELTGKSRVDRIEENEENEEIEEIEEIRGKGKNMGSPDEAKEKAIKSNNTSKKETNKTKAIHAKLNKYGKIELNPSKDYKKENKCNRVQIIGLIKKLQSKNKSLILIKDVIINKIRNYMKKIKKFLNQNRNINSTSLIKSCGSDSIGKILIEFSQNNEQKLNKTENTSNNHKDLNLLHNRVNSGREIVKKSSKLDRKLEKEIVICSDKNNEEKGISKDANIKNVKIAQFHSNQAHKKLDNTSHLNNKDKKSNLFDLKNSNPLSAQINYKIQNNIESKNNPPSNSEDKKLQIKLENKENKENKEKKENLRSQISNEHNSIQTLESSALVNSIAYNSNIHRNEKLYTGLMINKKIGNINYTQNPISANDIDNSTLNKKSNFCPIKPIIILKYKKLENIDSSMANSKLDKQSPFKYKKICEQKSSGLEGPKLKLGDNSFNNNYYYYANNYNKSNNKNNISFGSNLSNIEKEPSKRIDEGQNCTINNNYPTHVINTFRSNHNASKENSRYSITSNKLNVPQTTKGTKENIRINNDNFNATNIKSKKIKKFSPGKQKISIKENSKINQVQRFDEIHNDQNILYVKSDQKEICKNTQSFGINTNSNSENKVVTNPCIENELKSNQNLISFNSKEIMNEEMGKSSTSILMDSPNLLYESSEENLKNNQKYSTSIFPSNNNQNEVQNQEDLSFTNLITEDEAITDRLPLKDPLIENNESLENTVKNIHSLALNENSSHN